MLRGSMRHNKPPTPDPLMVLQPVSTVFSIVADWAADRPVLLSKSIDSTDNVRLHLIRWSALPSKRFFY